MSPSGFMLHPPKLRLLRLSAADRTVGSPTLVYLT